MAALAGRAADPWEGRRDAERALERGDGLERFRPFVAAQGGDPRVADDLSLLPQAPITTEVLAPRDGWLAAVDAEAVGRVAAALGAGRQRKDDKIDPAVAVELSAKLGDQVERGQPIGQILARDELPAVRRPTASSPPSAGATGPPGPTPGPRDRRRLTHLGRPGHRPPGVAAPAGSPRFGAC